MRRNSLVKHILIVGAVAVVAIVFLTSTVSAAGQPQVRQGTVVDQPIGSESPVLKIDFPATVVGIGWQGGSGTPSITLRFNGESGWSRWYALESSSAVERDGWQYFIEPVVTDQATELQYRITAGNPAAVKLVYVGEEPGGVRVNLFQKLFSVASAQQAATVLSRSQWQADETWRLDASGTERWPAEYVWPQAIVVHHTAGSDGGSDPAATVRGIYYWHAVALGWGDIGYQYLIDQNGTVYQGRFGGDGVVGAQVHRDKACATARFGGAQYEYNFNRGTVGIAILGDYEAAALTDTVRGALTSLIAAKAKDFGIVPTGTTYLFDGTYPTVVGHRDIDCTTCPGANLYSQLGTIREESQAKYAALGGVIDPVIKATFVGQSEQPVVVTTGEQKEVWVEFRNDGNVTWRNYQPTTLSVRTTRDPSLFYVAAWQSATSVAKLTTPNVAPGEVGRFTFTVHGPTDRLDWSEGFQLSFGDQVVAGTGFAMSAVVSGFPFAGSLEEQQIRPAMFAGTTQRVTLRFKNRGLQPWTQAGLKLNVYDLGGAASKFRDKSWASQYGQFTMAEATVQPNEFATYTFTLRSPQHPGQYLNTYRLDGIAGMIQDDHATITRVDSPIQATLVSQTVPTAVRAGWRPTVTVKLKNAGLTTWDRRTVSLHVYDLGRRPSVFYFPKVWSNSTTPVPMAEQSVKSGQVATFTFRLKPPATPGVYFSGYELTLNGTAINGGSFTRLTRVDP